MDSLFEVLRSSTDNNERKVAAAQLRQLQSDQPDVFLQHTYEGIASSQLASELRFFLCTLVLAFLDESWHSAVKPASQERFIALYVELIVSHSLPSVLLARKVGAIVALMARRGSRKAQVGGMPPLIQHVVTRYVAELASAARSQAYERVCYLLLSIHLLLKEMQGSRVGHVFEDVCHTMVAPLSGVFALLPDAVAMLAHYDMYLYLLKCSLRTFGRAVFDPAFCRFLLSATWKLAGGLGHGAANSSEAQRRLRLLEYALKITEATVVYFPSQLHELGSAFYFAEATTAGLAASSTASLSLSVPAASSAAASAAASSSPSLFPLLAAVVSSPVETVVSEKAVCRALRIYTALLSAEDGDAFIAHCLHNFSTSSSFPPFLQCVVSVYLADDTSTEALAAWSQQPERAAAELDVDVDDEESMMSCAEQLFLGFTGSTGCGAPVLAVAWAVVNHLLQDGGVGPITAALHAIGIGYYVMASEDNTSYLGFLREKLLPLLQPDAIAQVSPFITRRVVWLVGMWCESVTATCDRHVILAALEAVLKHAVHRSNVVLVLVSLKSTENFISDNHFTLSDMPATLVTTVLQTVQMLLAVVQSPTTVKELAGLVHVLTEKEVVQVHGETLVQLFLPPAQAIVQSYEAQAAKASAAGSTGLLGTGSGSDDDDANDSLGSLSMLLECLGSGVRHCSSDAAIWSLFHTLVQPCTAPKSAATAWAEDNAWELFLTMVQSSHAFDHAAAAQALPIALQHAHRDFGLLPLVFRVVYSLLLLRQDTVEGVVEAADVDAWVAIVRESPSAELCGAVTAALTAVARMSGGPLRVTLARHAVRALLTSADVQADQHTVPLVLALALGAVSVNSFEEQQQLLAEVHAAVQVFGGPQATFSTLLEQLVLLLDVSPSVMVSRALTHLLDTLSKSSPHSLSTEDQRMVQSALESAAMPAAAPSTMSGVRHQKGWTGEEAGEKRSPQEMLLEWLGDEDVPFTAPHVARVMSIFASLLS